jgi:hypothetical protein
LADLHGVVLQSVAHSITTGTAKSSHSRFLSAATPSV